MEIERLHKMLTDAGIEHEWNDRSKWYGRSKFNSDYNWGWQVRINRPNGELLVSAVEGFGTYGYASEDDLFGSSDLIEIMGLLTPEEEKDGSVLGWLTAEEVFSRIKGAVCGLTC